MNLLSFVALSMLLAGCQSTGAQGARSDQIRPTYDEKGHLERLEYDANGDGRIDTWGYLDGTRVVRLEVDENGDGKVDRWEYHGGNSPAQGTSQGTPGTSPGAASAGAINDTLRTLERVEESTHYDGRVDRWEYYTNGQLARREEDTDGDGQVDKWETYNAGVLTMMALDGQRRGRPDRRLIYKTDGSLDRIETDPNGTGTFTAVAK